MLFDAKMPFHSLHSSKTGAAGYEAPAAPVYALPVILLDNTLIGKQEILPVGVFNLILIDHTDNRLTGRNHR